MHVPKVEKPDNICIAESTAEPMCTIFHTYFRVYDGNTCSGLSPGGTQAYSSKAQPESSSEVEFLWKSYISLVTVFSISTGMAVTACSSRRHLQCTQIFLQRAQDNENLSRQCYFCVKTIKGIRASLKKNK